MLNPLCGMRAISMTPLLDATTRRALRDVALASGVLNCLGLAVPLASIVVFNKVLPHHATSTLTVVATGLLIVHLFDAALRSARAALAVHAGARLEAVIGRRVAQHLIRLPVSYFERTAAGETVERVRQLDTVRAFLTGEMPLLLVDLVFSIIGFGVLIVIDWRIGLTVLAVVPLFAGLSFLGDKAQRRLNEESYEAAAARASTLNEVIHAALTLKAMGAEALMERRLGDRVARSAWAAFRSQSLAGYVASGASLVHGLSSLTVLVIGADLVMNGQLSIGALVACSMLTGRSLAPVRFAATAWHRLREAEQAFARLEPFIAEEPEATAPEVADFQQHPVPLKCEELHFAHVGAVRPVLRGTSLTLMPGTITALVGASGGGKTTLGKLFAGLYLPAHGRVRLGAYDPAHMPAGVLRSHIGYVPQTPHLLSGTVLENLLFGLPAETRPRAIEAAQFTGAHAIIEALPKGYETVIGEGGVALSPGQGQLIATTRVVMRRPKVLILDEVTGALDPACEAHLMSNLRRATRTAGLVVLIITHRASTLAVCDRVALLAGGRITREGTAKEMMPLLLPRALERSTTVEAG